MNIAGGDDEVVQYRHTTAGETLKEILARLRNRPPTDTEHLDQYHGVWRPLSDSAQQCDVALPGISAGHGPPATTRTSSRMEEPRPIIPPPTVAAGDSPVPPRRPSAEAFFDSFGVSPPPTAHHQIAGMGSSAKPSESARKKGSRSNPSCPPPVDAAAFQQKTPRRSLEEFLELAEGPINAHCDSYTPLPAHRGGRTSTNPIVTKLSMTLDLEYSKWRQQGFPAAVVVEVKDISVRCRVAVLECRVVAVDLSRFNVPPSVEPGRDVDVISAQDAHRELGVCAQQRLALGHSLLCYPPMRYGATATLVCEHLMRCVDATEPFRYPQGELSPRVAAQGGEMPPSGAPMAMRPADADYAAGPSAEWAVSESVLRALGSAFLLARP